MLNAKSLLIPAAAGVLALAVSAVPQAGADDAKPAAAKAENAEKTKKKRRSSCAFRRGLNGYSVIDDRHFVLQSGTRDFLVTLSPGCRHLNFGMSIAIKTWPAAAMCVERGDTVTVDRFYTCWIRDIEPVEDKKEAEKLVEQRTKAAEEAKKKEDAYR